MICKYSKTKYIIKNLIFWKEIQMNSSYSLIDIRPLSGAIGAEIHGVDLNKAISKEQFLEVKSAFGQYGVIFLEIKI